MHKLKKIALYIILLLLFALVMLKGVKPAWTNIHSDFANYYVSAKLIAEGASLEKIYNNEWFQTKIKEYGIDTPGKFAPFPPVTAFLLLPLTPFNPITAQRIFTIINLAFIGLGTFAVMKITGWDWERCALIILIGGLSLINNIAFGQVYWLMTVFILLSFWWKENNRLIPAAIVLAFFTCLKYFPVVFIGSYFLIGLLRRKEGTAFKKNTDLLLTLYAALSIIVIFLFQFFFFGTEVIFEFIRSSFLPHLDGELKGQGLYSFQFQSWDIFFRNLFVPDPKFNVNPMVNWPEGKQVFKIIAVGIVSVLTSVVLVKLRSELLNKRRTIYLSLPAIAALVILPVSATYHFILLLPPVILLLCDKQINLRLKTIAVIVYSLIGFIPYSLAFKYGILWALPFAFPRLILITFLFGVTTFFLLFADKKILTNENSSP